MCEEFVSKSIAATQDLDIAKWYELRQRLTWKQEGVLIARAIRGFHQEIGESPN